MACGVTTFGQFIPQPNAYNPDANGDSFIGVDDVMGTLAVFNNQFSSSDSTATQSLTVVFSQAGLDSGESGSVNNHYVVPNGIDVLFLHSVDLDRVWIDLPEGSDYQSMLVIPSTNVTTDEGCEFAFYVPSTAASANPDLWWGENPVFVKDIRANEWAAEWTAFIRSNGRWLFHN